MIFPQKLLEKADFIWEFHLISFTYTANGKRQKSDLSWEFLKIENTQIKTAQNNYYG